MNPILWFAAGAFGLFFATKKARAVTMQPLPGVPSMPPGTSTEEKVATPFPGGYRRVKQAEVTPELLAKANAVRNSSGFTSQAYGTVMPFVASDGKEYAALVEQHYHEPGGSVKPWGYHHGVTLLARS